MLRGDPLSLTFVSIALVVGGAACYVAFVLYGAKIDGDREEVRKKGKHPVTDSDGEVHAREEEIGDGNKRS